MRARELGELDKLAERVREYRRTRRRLWWLRLLKRHTTVPPKPRM